MSRSHQVRRPAIFIRAFLKVLSRCLSFPLRLGHRLFHNILQLYSRLTSTRLKSTHADALSARVAGSSQPILPQHNQLRGHISSLSAPSSNTPPSISPVPIAPPSPESPAIIPSAENRPPPQPFIPFEVMRYDKGPTIKPTSNVLRLIQPLTRDYSDTQDSGDWCVYVHPKGALYFHDSKRHVYTDSNVQDPGSRHIIDSYVDELLALALSQGVVDINGGDAELVVQLSGDPPSVQICRYYLVDHAKRLLFWLHEQSTEMLSERVWSVEKLSHIKYAVESQYWQVYHSLPASLLKELMGVVAYASADMVTLDMSLSPFNGDELSKIRELIGVLQENVSYDGSQAHSICVIAKFMHRFTRANFYNFYGLPAARLGADQSVYVKDKTQKSKLIQTLSWGFNVALFGAPESHMGELRQVWVGNNINTSRWKALSSKLTSEWSATSVFSTVMLAVDVSFLAVPSVTVQGSQSVAAISTYISGFFILGSLVVALFFLTNQSGFINRLVRMMTRSTNGMRILAAMHGLPYAMLLWGMLCFIYAFTCQTLTITSTVMVVTTFGAYGIVLTFALWFVYTAGWRHVSTWLSHFRAKQATRSIFSM